MKKIFTILMVCCCIASAKAQISEYTIETVPNVRLQNKMRYVSNPDKILSQAACDSIDHMLYTLEQQTGIETAVAILSSIGNQECFDFAFNLGSKWEVGKKGKDNGLIILLVTDQRCIQFVTGYGLEGDLPDAICKRIQSIYMIPYLRQGDWNNGMVAGVRAVCARLDGSMRNDEEDKEASLPIILLSTFGFLLLTGLFTALAVRQAKRCPSCGKCQLVRRDSKLVSRHNGIKTEDETYVCSNCGHTVIRRRQSYDENYRGGGGGPFVGGFGGGFGGQGGGGFGGGSFGGGGGGSRF